MIDRVGAPGNNVPRNSATTKAALTEATLKALAPAVSPSAPEEGVVVSLSPQARAAATSADANPADPRAVLAQAAMAQATLAGTPTKAADGPDALYRAHSAPAVHPIPAPTQHPPRPTGIPGPAIRWLALVVLAGVLLWLMLGRGA
ncbi:MAG: hypothetical protein C0500_14710 [Sphingobium sp.]|nr:hypothetical protein [Sphingobium sp.]